LVNSSKLVEPLFTPSTKAEIGDHDENISFERCAEILGEADAAELKRLSTAVYTTAADYAAKRGIIIADTKFEFGRGANGQIVLGDEVLTPDSSRFWPADEYEEGRDQASFDKQYVRDWLSANWDKKGNPPHLPADVIERTSEKYIQAYESITGEKFPF
jgi:phosphoribosylaminoimidazole-succinocarboxamide synthase